MAQISYWTEEHTEAAWYKKSKLYLYMNYFILIGQLFKIQMERFVWLETER
jgi:hypothetical protein